MPLPWQWCNNPSRWLAAVVVLGNAGQILLGGFDADVLDGVGVDLGTDEVFDDVEQSFIAQRGEGGGDDGDGRVGGVALRQRDVEVLGVHLAGFVVDLAEALVEVEVGVGGGYFLFGEEFVGEFSEHFFVFGEYGVEIGGGVE